MTEPNPIALAYLNEQVVAAEIVHAEADVRTLAAAAGAALPC